MAARRTTFGKIERDRAKKAKAAAKRERRVERAEGGDDDEVEETTTAPRLSQEEAMDRLAKLHQRFDDGDIDFDDFEEQKAALLANLAVD